MAKLTWNDLGEGERFGIESIHGGSAGPVDEQVLRDLIIKGLVERTVGGAVLTAAGKDLILSHYA